MSTFDNVLSLGRQILSARSAEHDIHSSNIANSKTQNYQTKIPSFSVEFNKAQNLIHGGSTLFETNSPWKVEMKVKELPMSPGEKNNVQLDREVGAMTLNSIHYLSTVKILTKELAIQKYAISEGR